MERYQPRVSILTEEATKRIIDESMDLLDASGIVVEDPETLDVLGQMGVQVSAATHKARFKPDMVERAIASAPKDLRLHDFDGKPRFAFGDGQIHFNPGSAALFIYDATASVMRSPELADVARFARLCHTLEHIEAASTGVVPADVPEAISDSIRLYISLVYCDKPVVTGTFSEGGFPVMRDLLLARTGKDALRDVPCAIFDVCPTSPLRWSHLGCHDLKLCAQNAIPAQLIAMPLAGALSPMSLLATVVQHTVETLSGIVIHQAWTPGSPIIYGGSPAVFDMRHSTSPMGAIETLMIDLAYTQVGKSLGLPTQAYLGMSDAKVLDAQAGLETGMTITMAAAGSVDFVSGPGMLNFESCQCLEKLVLDNEICGMARRFKQGMEARGATLGADAIRQGLDEGNFLTTPDTLALYKQETFYPASLIDRKAHKQPGKVAAGRLVGEAERLIAERMSAYRAPEIQKARLDELKAVMAAALEPHGLKHLAEQCLEF
jgi:trimethylamine--corrinoid protein Co-methyltransferase